MRELRPVDSLDHIKQSHRLTHLVRLQRPDQMKLDIRMMLLQRRPFGLRLLHPVLAEYSLAGVDRALDDLGGYGFGHSDQLYRAGIATRGLRGKRDLLPHQKQARRNVAGDGWRRTHVDCLASLSTECNLTATAFASIAARRAASTG